VGQQAAPGVVADAQNLSAGAHSAVGKVVQNIGLEAAWVSSTKPAAWRRSVRLERSSTRNLISVSTGIVNQLSAFSL